MKTAIFLKVSLIIGIVCSTSSGKKSSYEINSNNDSEYEDTRGGVISTSDYDVTKILKRNEIYYTQGLFLDGGFLYESGGMYDRSAIIKMNYPSLEIVKKTNLDKKYFAEGIARCGDKIYQLTWQERDILIYDDDLKYLGKISMDYKVREGWGLTSTDIDNVLIATDGSNNLYYLDCNSNLKVTKKIPVQLNNGTQLDRLNEIIYVNGFIYANRYFDHRVFKIDAATGEVNKVYDFTTLFDHEVSKNTLNKNKWNTGLVLNGIAYDPARNIFLLTGKEWGYYYEVSFK